MKAANGLMPKSSCPVKDQGYLPDPEQKKADDMCQCNYGIDMWGDGYAVKIADQYPSDQALGMIMPMRRHVNYRVYFQLVTNP